MDEKIMQVFNDAYMAVIDLDNRVNLHDMMSKYERMSIAMELTKLQLSLPSHESA